MTTSGGALASTAAASFCGNWEFSTTTYSTWVLLAEPHCCIWSPRALSPSGVNDCQPQTVSLVPLDFPAATTPPAAGVAPAGAGAVVGAAGAAGEHAAAGSAPAARPRDLRNSRRLGAARSVWCSFIGIAFLRIFPVRAGRYPKPLCLAFDAAGGEARDHPALGDQVHQGRRQRAHERRRHHRPPRERVAAHQSNQAQG